MKEETIIIKKAGVQSKLKILIIEQKDRQLIRNLYSMWRTLSEGTQSLGARGVNIPEGISESAFCLEFNSARVIKVQGRAPGSFDAIDLKSFRRQQIKASSIAYDLSSFGPKSVYDELFFLDFYRDGSFDRKFDVYKIPKGLIPDIKVKKDQTFKEQQKEKRRPRFSIKRKIILPHKIKPFGTFCI